METWGTTVTVIRNMDDGTTIDIAVEVVVRPGERQWFNPFAGVGYPGSGPEVEIGVARLSGIEIELTDDEIDMAADAAIEKYVEDTGDPRR